MSSRAYSHPRTFVTPTGHWPEGPFTPDTPRYAVVTAALVTRLTAGMAAAGMSARKTALTSGMDPGTLSRILSGQAVPDLGTITALEETLNTDLWPGLNPGS